jgi:XTP/dITP diphosphohydrolase
MSIGKTVWIATGNHHKYVEARAVLQEFGVDLRHLEVDRMEIQADDLAEIAAYSAEQVESNGRSIVVEDAGLFIDQYGGFPGPYSSYVLQTIDLNGVLSLMESVEKRNASFKSAIALRDRNVTRCFRGIVMGEIAHSIRGTGGFGYDPIFIPYEGDGRTFGEMTAEEKNALSHRARAFRALGEWLTLSS